MQTDNPMLDGLARLFTDAAGAAQSVRAELDTFMRQRLERLVTDMDFVPREEFDAVKAMAAKAREENEKLESRLAALEAKLAGKARGLAPVRSRQLDPVAARFPSPHRARCPPLAAALQPVLIGRIAGRHADGNRHRAPSARIRREIGLRDGGAQALRQGLRLVRSGVGQADAANSSPPSRAAKSPPRTLAAMSSAAGRSTWSPAS